MTLVCPQSSDISGRLSSAFPSLTCDLKLRLGVTLGDKALKVHHVIPAICPGETHRGLINVSASPPMAGGTPPRPVAGQDGG